MNDSLAVAEPGVHLTPDGADVAVFSAHASAVFFCLYDADGEREVERVKLEPGADGLHRAKVAGVRAGARYGLRADGLFDPLQGHRFDVAKLLADPYAVAFDRPFRLHPSMSAFGADSGAFTPKAIALAPKAGEPGRQRIAWDRTVIYEANLRGLTKLRGDIPEAARGRFAGLAHPAVIEHLAGLGVTTVEIMPSDPWIDERHLPALGLSNAWGYNPVVLGAPDPRLAPDGWAEVRAATDALHAAGMEVILDIVLNHNGESDELGPTISFRGLDNASYFRLQPDDCARYINDTGTGNCLALDRPPVVRMAIAAMARWMILGGIDGFRFDLATALGRRASGFDPHAPMFAAIAEHPILKEAKLIAEPWDVGPGGYRVGAFPEGWGEWNDRFRDAARRFWRGDARMRGELATRLAGSRDLFANAPSAAKGVNFVVAHDGFVLADVVAYAHKHNEANGEYNRDGTNENYSWNHGAEGRSEDPAVLAARARDQRNLLALTFVARGTPMLAMGSELGHSQSGNNNAYAQDNPISWIDWSRADASLIACVRRLAQIRREHPAFASPAWLSGRAFDSSGLPDVEWRDAEGPLVSSAQWDEPEGNVLVAVFAARAPADLDRAAVAFNRADRPTFLRLPEPREGKTWRILLDTADDAVADAPLAIADRARIAPRAALILAEFDVDSASKRNQAPDAREIDVLAEAAGIAPEWWDVGGRRTIVSAETKLALLEALRLPAGSQPQLRESLARLIDETSARRLPGALVRRLGEPLRAPVRFDPGEPPQRIEPAIIVEDGRTISWRAAEGASTTRVLADGRSVAETTIDLPDLPVGRHRLLLDGVECALTVAPPEAYGAKGALRRRFGLSMQLYALRRDGDQGIGDLTTLGLGGERAGRAGAAFLGVNPLHALDQSHRLRCSPYHPSDRRFLDPIHIDVLDAADLPRDEASEAVIASLAGAIGTAARASAVDYEAVWAIKRQALEARFAAFERARANKPGEALFADHARFVAQGGDALRRFAIFQAIAEERAGEDWRRWPQELRAGERDALERNAAEHPREVALALYMQWLADRQLAGAATRAKEAGLDIGLYRDLAVGAAPDGAESWARAGELAQRVSVGAPPDPFSAQGQIWNVQPPDPHASAKDGWRGFGELIAANMRHAGMLRIDHAMGLTRLFVVPDGAPPAEGAYLAYPVDDLLGHLALESQRHGCMVVGEDLGTVPEGFRDRMTRADILGMRVLWFERRGADFLPPALYPPLSVACVATHDLPTLAGWWSGADIAERLSLGLVSLEDAHDEIGERLSEKRALLAALGLAVEAQDLRRRCPTRSPAPFTPSWRTPARCSRARNLTIWRASGRPPICRAPTGSGPTGATSSPMTSRRCSLRRVLEPSSPRWRRGGLDRSALFGIVRLAIVAAARRSNLGRAETHGGLGAVGGVQLRHDAAQMRLHRPFGDLQIEGDGLVGAPGAQAVENLALPRRQARERVFVARRARRRLRDGLRNSGHGRLVVRWREGADYGGPKDAPGRHQTNGRDGDFDARRRQDDASDAQSGQDSNGLGVVCVEIGADRRFPSKPAQRVDPTRQACGRSRQWRIDAHQEEADLSRSDFTNRTHALDRHFRQVDLEGVRQALPQPSAGLDQDHPGAPRRARQGVSRRPPNQLASVVSAHLVLSWKHRAGSWLPGRRWPRLRVPLWTQIRGRTVPRKLRATADMSHFGTLETGLPIDRGAQPPSCPRAAALPYPVTCSTQIPSPKLFSPPTTARRAVRASRFRRATAPSSTVIPRWSATWSTASARALCGSTFAAAAAAPDPVRASSFRLTASR